MKLEIGDLRDDDGESLMCIGFVEDGKTIWTSPWHGIREFFEEYKDGRKAVDILRREVREACKEYKVKADLSSEDYHNWKLI